MAGMNAEELLDRLDQVWTILSDDPSESSFSARKTLEWIGRDIRAHGLRDYRPDLPQKPGEPAPWEGESTLPKVANGPGVTDLRYVNADGTARVPKGPTTKKDQWEPKPKQIDPSRWNRKH